MSERLTTQQAAEVLQVTAGTLMVWRCTKRYPLRYIRVGRCIRYRLTDLKDFLDKRTVSGVPEPQMAGVRAARRKLAS